MDTNDKHINQQIVNHETGSLNRSVDTMRGSLRCRRPFVAGGNRPQTRTPIRFHSQHPALNRELVSEVPFWLQVSLVFAWLLVPFAWNTTANPSIPSSGRDPRVIDLKQKVQALTFQSSQPFFHYLVAVIRSLTRQTKQSRKPIYSNQFDLTLPHHG